MKIAPLMRVFVRQGRLDARLVHTGQHYYYAMNETFFRQLDIPPPYVSLEVGSGSHAQQTASLPASRNTQAAHARLEVFDPLADPDEAEYELGVRPVAELIRQVDLRPLLKAAAVVFDVKSALDRRS